MSTNYGYVPKKFDGQDMHLYRINRVPKEFLAVCKAAIKQLSKGRTLASYLRERVAQDAKKRLPGKEFTPTECIENSPIDWKEIKWIKNPTDLVYDAARVWFPKAEFEDFKHNCAVRKETLKFRLCSFLLDAIRENRDKKRDTNESTTNSGEVSGSTAKKPQRKTAGAAP